MIINEKSNVICQKPKLGYMGSMIRISLKIHLTISIYGRNDEELSAGE